MPSRHFTRSAASPDMKKFVCIASTRSGSRRTRAIMASMHATVYGNSGSFSTSAGGLGRP